MITGEGANEDDVLDTQGSLESALSNHSSGSAAQNHTHGEDAKIICFIDNLLELVGSKCQFCQLQCKRSTRVVGCALEVNMLYSAGHSFT